MNVINLEEFKRQRLAIFAAPEEQPAPTAYSPATAEDYARLRAAVLELHKATLGQHAKAKKFHRVTSELGDQIRRLEASCKRFDRNFRTIRINPLARSAKHLIDTMDTFLVTQSS